jgi:acyl carrier protein
MERRFNVAIRNMETPLSSLWALDVDAKQTRRLTRDTSYTVTEFRISEDGRWIAFRGIAADRYSRNITEQAIHGDYYLLDVASGSIERLTNNREVPESQVTLAATPDDLELDSLAMVELAIIVDKQLGIKVTDDELIAMSTVADIVKLLEQRGSASPA